MIYNNLLDLIGNTPVVKIDFKDKNIADVYVKLEKFNLSGSVKDRAALGMIEAAEKEGLLKESSVIIEPTSGNTGIALALIGRLKGYKVIIVMPDTMSIERRSTLKAYGAELILTDGTKGMGEAIAVAEKLAAENPNYFLPQQFNNKANPKKHYETTGKEILDDFKVVDAFVAGVGTGGTIVGVARRLKERSKDTLIVGIEPSTSAVLSGGKPGKHSIQGIGTGFIPENYDASVIDEIVKISSEEAVEYAKKASHDFGLFVGISSGANIAAAYQIAKKLGKGKIVVTIAPDGGEKYLSVEAFQTK
nr:cysteine synthase A [uncultured Fusobacterium sp.]